MLTTKVTICLLLSVLQPLVQSYPTWYHHNGQYGVPAYSSRTNVHYLQEGRPVHTGDVEYRLHRGYPQWNLPYDTDKVADVNIPLLNSINQRLSAYMQTSSHLRDRLAAMGWHGGKSVDHHRHPYRPKVPFIQPSQMGPDHIRPASAVNPHQHMPQAGVFDNDLDGGRKKILGSLPHYMILEVTPANEKPAIVPKYDGFGEREKHRPLTTTAVPTLSTEISRNVEATPSTANTSFDWKLKSSESPKFVIKTTTSRTSLLAGNQNASSPTTQLEEKSTDTPPSTFPGKDTGFRGPEVKNYTVVSDKNLITASPIVKETTTTKEEIVHTIPIDFGEGTEKSTLEHASETENPHIPVISLSGEDLKIIESLKPGVNEGDEDKSGFISKGESIYIEFPDAAYGKDSDGQNVKEVGNEQGNTMSGILKLLKGLFENGSQDVITQRKNWTDSKPGSTVEGRTEVSSVYYDSVNKESYGNSSRGIVLTDDVKPSSDTSSMDEPTTVNFRNDTDYDGHNIEFSTESNTMLYYDEDSDRQLPSENATKHITTLSNTKQIKIFPSELGVTKEFGATTASLASTETVTKTTQMGTAGHDTRTEPAAVTTLEEYVTVTAEGSGKNVLSGITVPEDVTISTEPYYQTEREGIPMLKGVFFTEDVTYTTEGQERVGQDGITIPIGIIVPEYATVTFTEDSIVTTERHHQGEEELTRLDEVTIEDVRITTEHDENLGKERDTELIGVTITEGVTVSTEHYEEMWKEGTTDSITDNTKHSDQTTQEGSTPAEDVEVETESYILANTTSAITPQQPKEGNVNVEYDEDLSTTINYANEFTTNIAPEYTTEIWINSTTEFTSQGQSLEYTTQVMETEVNDGGIIIKLSTAHGEGTINTTEYFTSTETHGTNDSVTEITEVTADMDMGQAQNVTPDEELSTYLPKTIVTDSLPDDEDVGLISITGETEETTTAFEEMGKENAVTKRTSESTSQIVPTTFKNPAVEERTGTEYLTEIYTTVKDSTMPFYEETDSTVQLTHDTFADGEGTTHSTEDNDLNTTSYPTTYPGLDGVYDVNPTSTLGFTNNLGTEGENHDSESSTERESKELISSNDVNGKDDALTGEEVTFQQENNVPGTEGTYILSPVDQTGPTPQPVEGDVTLTEGWELEVSIPKITTQNAYNDVYTTEELQTVSSVEGWQDLSVENTRKGNTKSTDHTPAVVNEWQNVDVEESLEFSTVYEEIGETLATEGTTQTGAEEKSSDNDEGTIIPQTARNIVEEISTNEPFEFTIEKEMISTVEMQEYSTLVSPIRGLSDDESLPYTSVEHTTVVQEVVGLTTERGSTNIVDNQEVKTQIPVNEEISTIHHEEPLPRNDDGLILATTVKEPSSTESLLSTQMTIAAETTERDEQNTAQTADDELSNRDELELTTRAILEETTTSDEDMKLTTQDSEEPLIPGERTVTTNSPLGNGISTVEQNHQFTGQSPSAETATVQQGLNITPSSTSGKDTSITEEYKEITTHTSEEETPTVGNDQKSTTNIGTENIDTSTENYFPTSTVGIVEDSTTVQEDVDLTTQEFKTTMQNTVQEQDESHTVTEEKDMTTKKLTEEENTISPDIKVLTRTNPTTIILELETASQPISREESLTTETVPELRTEEDIEEMTPTIEEDFKTTTTTPDGEETSTTEEEPEFETLTTTTTTTTTTTVFPDEETSTPDIETTTEFIETVTATYEAHTILDFNPPVEPAEASTRSSVLSSNADNLRRSDIEIDNDNHHGDFYPYQDLLQVMFHGMPSSTEKIIPFTTENNANIDDIDVRISTLQHLTTNYEDIDERSGRTLISNYNGRKDKLFQEEKIILESSTIENDDSVYYQNETDSTAIYNPDSELQMPVAEIQPYDGLFEISQEDTDLVFEEPSTMSPTSTGETSTTERLKLNHISTAHLNTLENSQSSDEEPNPNDHKPTFSVWDLLELIPVIIEELRNGHITEEEYEVFGEIFGDLWPVLVAEAKGSSEREHNGQPGIGEMLSKIREDQEMQELMAERHRRNQHNFEKNYSPFLTALLSNRNSKVQSWRPLPGGNGITRIFPPRPIGRTVPRKQNVQPSDLETQETRNIIRRLKNIKLDTWLMLWDILSGSEYFRGERDTDGSGHSEAEATYDTSIPRQKYLPFPNSEDDTEVGDEYEPSYDDDYSEDDGKIADLLAILPDPPKPRED